MIGGLAGFVSVLLWQQGYQLLAVSVLLLLVLRWAVLWWLAEHL